MGNAMLRPAISPRGRLAALVVAGCLIAGGAAFLVFSFDELRCPYRTAICGTTVGIAGLIWAASLGAIAIGVATIWSVRGRAVTDEGSEGWVIVEAALVLAAAAVVALLVPARTCPQGFRLYRSFRMCIDPSSPGRRVIPHSQIPLEWLVFAVGAAVAFVVLRQRRSPPWAAAVVTIASWAGALGWLLFETVWPRTY